METTDVRRLPALGHERDDGRAGWRWAPSGWTGDGGGVRFPWRVYERTIGDPLGAALLDAMFVFNCIVGRS